MKILHIEDNLENRMLVRTVLQADGYTVVEAEDGLAGIETAVRETPALILLDINLPGIEGYEVVSILKSFPALAGVPVIAVTAYAMGGDRQRTLVAGCDGYIQKPIDVDAFPRQVTEFLEGKRERLEETEASPYLRELNQRLVYRLLSQVEELKRVNQHFFRRASQLEDLHRAVGNITSEIGVRGLLEGLLPALAQALGTRSLTVDLHEMPDARISVFGEGAPVVPPVLGEAAATEDEWAETEWTLDLTVHGRSIGVMTARHLLPVAARSDEEQLLKIVANQVAIAVENARLYAETQARLRQTETLLSVSQAVGSTLDLAEIARRTTREMVKALGADMGAAWSRDPEEDIVVALAGYHVPHDFAMAYTTAPIETHKGFADKLRLFEGVLAAEDSAADPRFQHPLLAALPHRSLLIVPMRAKNEDVIGGFAIAWTTARHTFTDDERRLVEGIARQAAIAMENARLLEAEREARERLAASEARYRELSVELGDALRTVEESQQRIVQGERLRALGQMAGGVAHDFNNTLGIIVGRAEVLLSELEDPKVRHQLNVILRVALDAAQTVRRIQEFTRMRRSRPFHSVNLNDVVREVVDATRSRWKDEAQAKGLRYDVVVEQGPAHPVVGDASDLREALTNIVFNAIDAMPNGGRVTCRTTVENGRVVCTIADTGIGMPDDVRQRVFDPFFTTKGERGTGLGLSVVYGTITRHGGDVEVQSEPGRGSVFTIRLPVAPAGAELLAPGAPVPARTARILVVDDEQDMRDMLRDLLSLDGHVVTTCADGESAIARLREESVDLVITDLGMPGISGWDVAAFAKTLRPDLPVAMVTGWGDRVADAEAQERGVDFVMAKPFQREDVRALVAMALDAKPAETISPPKA